jgi:hypothetical protein
MLSLSQDLSHQRTLQTPLQCITAASYLPGSGLLALGSYSPCVLLVDPASGEQAGKLAAAAGSAALSLAGWQEGGAAGLGLAGGRELLGVGDADGGVSLMEVLVDDVVSKQIVVASGSRVGPSILLAMRGLLSVFDANASASLLEVLVDEVVRTLRLLLAPRVDPSTLLALRGGLMSVGDADGGMSLLEVLVDEVEQVLLLLAPGLAPASRWRCVVGCWLWVLLMVACHSWRCW